MSGGVPCLMATSGHLLFHLLCFLLWFQHGEPKEIAETTTSVHIGLVLNLNSTVGAMADRCITLAISDFYALYSNYRTRLSLHTRDSEDVVGAAFSALELINNGGVNAIIGPQTSTQANFVNSLGEKARVPIISFSASSPTLSTTQNRFFIRTAQDDSFQVQVIASIVQAYGWHEAVLVYEDTEYGNGLIPYLQDAFQQFDINVPYRCVISPSSSSFKILIKLNQLLARQAKVFVVHMSSSLGSKLFLLAKEAGLMSEGYAWIVTDGFSTLFDSMGEKVFDSMRGVLGIRPHIPESKRLQDFKLKWGSKSSESHKSSTELNLFGLRAYDTVWALAMAVEMVGAERFNVSRKLTSRSTSQPSNLGISETGSEVRDMLLYTRFKGLSGDFHLVNGQLQASIFEIINLKRKKERVIGYWTPGKGFSRKLGNPGEIAYFNTMDGLEPPVWPGGTRSIPKGWAMPTEGRKLNIGVPIRAGFKEYLKMENDSYTNEPIISGFSYDVFLAAIDTLPFAVPHKLTPYMIDSQSSFNTYSELLYQIELQNFDAVIGDIMITANRSQYVDFTLPYLESNVAMVVKIKDDGRRNVWIFLKPLSWDLWLTTGIAFIFTGLVVWVLEHRINTEFRGPPDQQLGTILWFSFSFLVFAHREKVINNLSRFVLIIWIFVVLILTQSYTASLASMLTVQRLQPAVVDVDELRRNGDFVGHRAGSCVKDLLIKQLHFDESKLRHYSTPEEFHEALSNGSQNGGVSAIFEAQHLLHIFLPKYCNQYMTTGPTYKTDGLGFAFPQGSPLVSYMSRALLSVTEDKEKMDAIRGKYFAEKTECQDQQTTISSDSLSLYSFGGLFIITGAASMFSLLIYVSRFLYSHWPELNAIHQERTLWSKVTELAKHFDRQDPSLHPSGRNQSSMHPEPTI